MCPKVYALQAQLAVTSDPVSRSEFEIVGFTKKRFDPRQKGGMQ